jgi:hypothetical protein
VGATTVANLVVTIKRRSDNVQFGGTLTITPAQANAAPDAGNGWKAITGNLTSTGTLAAATQYYIEYSSTAANAGVGWQVAAVDANGAVGGLAGYGGTTDRGAANATELDAWDVTGILSTVPAAPSGWAVALNTQTLTASVCDVLTVQRASMSWTATALGGTFLRYEIQRTEDGGTTWTTIAYVGTESVVAFVDYEAKRGVSAGYRIRVVRSDGAQGDWSTTISVTKATTNNCVLSLVSNYAPTLNVNYDYDPDVAYDFLETNEQVNVAVYGRDYSLLPLQN